MKLSGAMSYQRSQTMPADMPDRAVMEEFQRLKQVRCDKQTEYVKLKRQLRHLKTELKLNLDTINEGDAQLERIRNVKLYAQIKLRDIYKEYLSDPDNELNRFGVLWVVK